MIGGWMQNFVRDAKQEATAGVKLDLGKNRWDLLPWAPIREVVRVLDFGAQKYAPDNWQKVESPRSRYFAAAQRHVTSWFMGETLDEESGLHHLAHACCCLLFLIWFDLQNDGVAGK